MSNRRIPYLCSLRVLALLLLTSSTAFAQGTQFSYQGRLTDAGNLADGLFDMQFKLFDTATVGTGVLHGTITNPTVQVSDGVFTVQLDFGADAFDGSPRYLEIGVRPAGNPNPYTILGPRQPVTASPYAIRSSIANSATNALQLGGVGSSGFIQNTTTQQSSTNFNISGNGTLGGTLSAGAIGIGTSTSLGKLQVVTTSDTNPTQVTAWDSRHVVIGGPDNNGSIGISYDQANQAGYIQARSPNASWRNLVLQSGGGNVGIGVTNPASRLDVGDRMRVRQGASPSPGIWFNRGSGFDASDVAFVGMNEQNNSIGFFGAGAGWGFQMDAALGDVRIKNIGLGLIGPSLRVENIGSAGVAIWSITSSTDANLVISNGGSGDLIKGFCAGCGNPAFRVRNDGGVMAQSSAPGLGSPALRADNSNPNGVGIWTTNNSVDATLVVSNGGTGDLVRGFSSISGDPIFAVQNNGTTSTRVLQITGGSDLAEHFEVGEGATPGMVVAIDPQNAGKLAIARGSYNRKVAGVISGAGNLSAGMVLPDASAAKESLPVALSGRVWVFCDATRHPIIPGDLLTTSGTAGHAMKVINHTRAQGAIIGKAMTELKRGRGLVLVLVTLQ